MDMRKSADWRAGKLVGSKARVLKRLACCSLVLLVHKASVAVLIGAGES